MLSPDLQSVFKLLESAKAIQSVAARYRALYAPRLSPDFSIFDFLDTRENGISRILKWLLDPKGSHAQGDLFLNRFAELIGFERLEGDIHCRTEFPTADRRRIDVVACAKGYAIAIENKIWDAPDQERQVADYVGHLESQFAEKFRLKSFRPHWKLAK